MTTNTTTGTINKAHLKPAVEMRRSFCRLVERASNRTQKESRSDTMISEGYDLNTSRIN